MTAVRLDPPPVARHGRAMVYLGQILRLMLVVTLLPWAAYHGAARAAVARDGAETPAAHLPAAHSETAGSGGLVQPAPETGQSDRLSPQSRRCKTGVLSGFGCAPDATLTALGDAVQPPLPRAVRSPQGRNLAPALPEAPPRRPPRAA